MNSSVFEFHRPTSFSLEWGAVSMLANKSSISNFLILNVFHFIQKCLLSSVKKTPLKCLPCHRISFVKFKRNIEENVYTEQRSYHC